ncbi:MAG: LCP family protein [Chloroflexi bacterium]|nr:LCP family protein [Chloroflexota bacterium]
MLVRDRRVIAAGALALAAVVFLVGSLLYSEQAEPPAPAAIASPTATPEPTLPPSATPTPTPEPTSEPTPDPAKPEPTPSPSPALGTLADGRYTVLVLGSDSDSQRRARGKGWLTDAITVISVATDGSRIAMFSLPRDTSDIPMPDGSVWARKVNAMAPTLGPAATRDAMGLLLGIPIDRYALIDMDDFRRLVDAVGGVTVHLPYAIADNRCSIGAGTHHLGGSLALCFARHRAVDSDYARAGRHQQLLLAIRDRIMSGAADPGAVVASLGSLQTDIPATEIPTLMALAGSAQSADVNRVVFGPEYMSYAGIAGARGWISVPDVGAIRATVGALVPRSDGSVGAAPADDRRQRTGGDAKVE